MYVTAFYWNTKPLMAHATKFCVFCFCPLLIFFISNIFFQTNMPPTKPCDGCCVKMVQFIGTHHYQIKRTCTDTFEVNFFMVNHACMTEGHRHGHMCFCEEDECNGVERINTFYWMNFLAVIMTMKYLPWVIWLKNVLKNFKYNQFYSRKFFSCRTISDWTAINYNNF